jgi:NADH-quinone oxidoreductase subunit M
MGFVLLGISVWNDTALKGAVLQILCHGVGTGSLFMLTGALQERIRTRELYRMGGFWAQAPRMGAVWLFFALASLGLPGLGNFIGEFLVLLGAYPVSAVAAVVAATGLIFATVYALWMVWRIFFSSPRTQWSVSDITVRELAPLCLSVAILIWIGLFPQTVINLTEKSFRDRAVSAKTSRVVQNSVRGLTEEATAKSTSGQPLRGFYADR